MSRMDLYGGQDPRDLPAYGTGEAAHYLRIPPSTLRTWVRGRVYPAISGDQHFKPVLELADKTRQLLSFVNLIEAHVLAAMRRSGVGFRNIRRGLDYLTEKLPSPHPLASKDFQTDGVSLFVEHLENIINVSQSGQLGLLPVLETYLTRVERDIHGLATRLRLFTRRDVPPGSTEPPMVIVDPRIEFGRPVLIGSHIATKVIFQRFEAGDSIEELADDYARTSSEIQEAIRCEQYRQAA